MRRFLIAVGLVLIAALVGLLALAALSPATVTAARFASLRAHDLTGFRAFVRAMPKGADLHVHLSGAVYAEDLIAWAVKAKLCIRLADMAIDAPPCFDPEKVPIASVLRNQALYDALVNTLSVRNFVATPGNPSGHDQFFATFSKFGAITGPSATEMTVEMLRHYAADNVQHTELMVSFLPSGDRRALAELIGTEQDFAKRLDIIKAKIDEFVAREKRVVDVTAGEVENTLGCQSDKTKPGCNVSYRLIVQVSRGAEERDVFVQTAFAAAMIKAHPLVVGLNFVGPEDYRVAREDYRRHMEMIGFLAKDVPVALHAGELWGGLVPPDDLTFHIRQAVEVAGARRIGHGVALAYERRSAQLLEQMRKRNVAVEINLTSNDVILGVRGKDHPLMAYRSAGVPTVLSTDDPGVSRIDLSHEYFRAARDYPLSYRELKEMARASIAHSFLDAEGKRKAMDAFDSASRTFETNFAGETNVLTNARAIAAHWLRLN